ncbi:MAG: TlpA disulfide reductase family protein [Bacteroidota bacterium]
MTGKWQATLGLTEEKPEAAVGEFQQTGNHLTGTFLTETGDYRYLEGTVQGDNAWLSCFDGSHAFLFEMKIVNDSTLTGAFYSGKHYQTTWEAKRNAQAKLADPDSLTFLKPGFEELIFAFENPDGKLISPENPEYQGKVKLVQIMGTWCPNCKDETEFLTQYLSEKNDPNLAVISLAFEKHTDKAKAHQIISTYKNRLGIPWEVVHAGMNKKDEASKALPALNQVLAFPTLIVLDKNNRVRRIHTGFSGPATSEYEDFKKGFDAFVSQLLTEG